MDVIDALDDDSEGDVDNPTEIETRTRSNMVLQVENPTVQVGTVLVTGGKNREREVLLLTEWRMERDRGAEETVQCALYMTLKRNGFTEPELDSIFLIDLHCSSYSCVLIYCILLDLYCSFF